jgi:hypothetical protein
MHELTGSRPWPVRKQGPMSATARGHMWSHRGRGGGLLCRRGSGGNMRLNPALETSDFTTLTLNSRLSLLFKQIN